MVDADQLSATLRAMGPSAKPEARRRAERKLEDLVLELLDAKVRHGLGSRGKLRSLTNVAQVAMGPAAGLTAAARVVLNRFCYRLAHVAMRSREWDLALELLEAVLAGEGDLTRARLYRALCLAKQGGSLSSSDLHDLLESHRQEAAKPAEAPALDVLVQDPTTNLLELFLLAQDAPGECLDHLYDPDGCHRTTGLTLLLHPEGETSRSIALSEWLAEAHLQEYRCDGWLVVDATVNLAGEQGRGSRVRVPGGNVRSAIVVGLLQELGKTAPRSRPQDSVREEFLAWDNERLVVPKSKNERLVDPKSKNQPRWESVTSTELVDIPGRKVIRRSPDNSGHISWELIPPYVVVLKDEANVLRQAAGSSQ